MTMLRRVGLFVSVVAASAVLGAPIALADGDHGDRNRGGDGDDHHAVVVQNGTPQMVVVDEDNDANQDINEDRNEVKVVAQPAVDNDHEVNDLNDDDD